MKVWGEGCAGLGFREMGILVVSGYLHTTRATPSPLTRVITQTHTQADTDRDTDAETRAWLRGSVRVEGWEPIGLGK